MPVQQMKAGSSISPISPLKLVAMATSLERSQNECWNNHPLYSIATNPENLVKIDPVSIHAEIIYLEGYMPIVTVS